MSHVLLNAAAFVLIMCVGRFLDARHIIPASSGETLKKILMNFTLPAAIIVNFNKNTLSSGGIMLALAVLGLAANVIMVVLGMLMTRSRNAGTKALYMLCLPAMNIGTFCIPFVQSFLPALGTVTASMFDVGNSIACTGGTYAFTSEYISEKSHGFDWATFGKRIVTSTPLMTYVVMFTVTTLGFHLPEAVTTLINPLAAANPCIAMLMIGVLIHIEFKREYMLDIALILGLRHLFSIILAALCYWVLPFDLVIRQALVIVAFAPLSVIAPAYVGMCGGDEGKASALNSFSIILSVTEITLLLMLMGLN
ncbi:AEC family transporter [Alloscardovia omnicolens]|uniref:AEC family transporter n=1 Tax=Alloscardovia omnicolens TaxID=419015 RepID=UPI003A68DA91